METPTPTQEQVSEANAYLIDKKVMEDMLHIHNGNVSIEFIVDTIKEAFIAGMNVAEKKKSRYIKKIGIIGHGWMAIKFPR